MFKEKPGNRLRVTQIVYNLPVLVLTAPVVPPMQNLFYPTITVLVTPPSCIPDLPHSAKPVSSASS